MKRGQLGLSIREHSPTRQTQVPLTARAVGTWLETLPMANIGETARQVYQFLVDCNSQAVDPVERLKIMQAMTKITNYIGDALRKHYVGHTVSLNEKQRKVAALAQAMQSEMAMGYKAVLEDALTSQQLKQNNTILAPATQGSLHYLSLVLLRCFQLYAQQPQQLWREIHILYSFAEQRGFMETTINAADSVKKSYLQILLIACSNPYQLRQKEIEQLFEATATVSDRVGILPFSRDAGLYYVDLGSDAGPQNISLATGAFTSEWRSLQLDKLVEHLHEELRNCTQVKVGSPRNEWQQLGAPLLRHLVRAFGNLTTRAFSRTPANGTIKVAVGISATHFLLAGETKEAAPPISTAAAHEPVESHHLTTLEGSLHNATLVDDSQARARVLGINKNNSTGTSDPWEKMYRTKQAWEGTNNNSLDMNPAMPNSFTNSTDVKYDYQIAAMVNISPGGYCLALRGTVPSQTQTGEIIGLMESDAEGFTHWNIGMIRWMKRVPDAALQLGVQLIAPNARPVQTQVRNSQMAAVAFQRSLLLPALKGIGQPATLITSPMPYAVNQKVRIKDEQKMLDIRLSKQIASSASFKQFQFEEITAAADESARNTTAAPARKENPDSFDTVWELL